MHTLVDGDILVYKAGCAAQKVIHQGFDVYGQLIAESNYIKDLRKIEEIVEIKQKVEAEPLKNALYLVKKKVEMILRETDADEHTIFITAEDIKKNFRYKVDNTYKANRKAPKPVHYDAIRQYIIKKYNTVVVDGHEADDALGIVQCELNKNGTKSCIASIDKDLLQIPGLHYNIDTGNWMEASDPGKLWLEKTKSGKWQLKGYGEVWFWAQNLLGDPTDNIKGLKGYGDVKTFKYLTKEGQLSIEERVTHLFRHKLGDLEVNKQLLWIKREI